MKDYNLEIVRDKRDYYRQMADMCDDLLNGKSLIEVCDEYDVTLPAFRGRVFRREPSLNPVTSDELIKAAENLMSSEEKLLRDILEFHIKQNESKIVIDFPPDFESTLRRVIDESIDERSRDMLYMRYFEDLSYDAIGAKYDVTKERVRQVIRSSIRKLRRRDRILRIIYGDAQYNEYIKGINQCKYIESVLGNLKAVKSKSEILDSIEQQLHDAENEIEQDLQLPIDVLDLDVRTYNCLKRGGINTIDQLLKTSDRTLMKLRNFGENCLNVVNECLMNHGFTRNA